MTDPEFKVMVKEWLDFKGFDGVFCRAGNCGCSKDNLFPCNDSAEEIVSGMCPGYKYKCECGDHDFRIESKKPENQTDADAG